MDEGAQSARADWPVRAVGVSGAGPAERRDGEYRTRLGLLLRKARVDLGLSLADVQRVSDGVVSAPALSSYERADRAVTATKLAYLAGLYGVPISSLLPEAARRSSIGSMRRVEFDMDRLRAREPSEVVGSLLRFLNHITRPARRRPFAPGRPACGPGRPRRAVPDLGGGPRRDLRRRPGGPALAGAPGWDRTSDRPLRRRMLFPLSYGGGCRSRRSTTAMSQAISVSPGRAGNAVAQTAILPDHPGISRRAVITMSSRRSPQCAHSPQIPSPRPRRVRNRIG